MVELDEVRLDGYSLLCVDVVAPISDSDAEPMTFLRIFLMMCVGPFHLQFVGSRVFYKNNKWPQTRLRDFIADRY